MLQADKQVLLAGVKRNALELRQKELDFNVERFTNLATLASVIAGFSFESLVELEVPHGAHFDYIMSMEDLVHGQRIANYSVEYRTAGGGGWRTLVSPSNHSDSRGLGDRPDGHDPRDSHIGHKRIDLPEAPVAGIDRIRLSCIRALEEPVYIRKFSLHRRTVPW